MSDHASPPSSSSKRLRPALRRRGVEGDRPHQRRYRAFIEAAPFFALSTVGPEGVDCSPRGDEPGFVRVADERTLMIPDRRGNNRIDSLRNIVRDPRVSLLFLIPGVGETFRVIGRASISTDPALLESFVFVGKTPRAVIVVCRERLLPVLQGDPALKTVGAREHHRPQEPAEQWHDPGGDHQGRQGRRRVRQGLSGSGSRRRSISVARRPRRVEAQIGDEFLGLACPGLLCSSLR